MDYQALGQAMARAIKKEFTEIKLSGETRRKTKHHDSAEKKWKIYNLGMEGYEPHPDTPSFTLHSMRRHYGNIVVKGLRFGQEFTEMYRIQIKPREYDIEHFLKKKKVKYIKGDNSYSSYVDAESGGFSKKHLGFARRAIDKGFKEVKLQSFERVYFSKEGSPTTSERYGDFLSIKIK